MSRFVAILVALLVGLCPVLLHARGGGGCLKEGTVITTPDGLRAVECLKPGDSVWAVSSGALVSAKVCAVRQVQPERFYELVINGAALQLTAEHPVQIAPGEFRKASQLRAGDAVCCLVSGRIQAASVESVRQVSATTPAWNLLVSPGGTYVAGGVVVHNKGCFLPDTLIRRPDGSAVPISRIHEKDELLAFTGEGLVVTASVQQVISHEVDEYKVLKTAHVTLNVTDEHPFYVGQGHFKTVEALRVGDAIYAFDGAGLTPQAIESIATVKAPVRVYNLHTDEPNTFFANGMAVHNKGGGCLREGTPISTPSGTKAIERFKPGDAVFAVVRGALVPATVCSIMKVQPDHFHELVINGQTLRVTEGHPVETAPGEFRMASLLQAGDPVYSMVQGRAQGTRVEAVRQLPATVPAWNLLVSPGGTYVADGVVVHNKGCFLPETTIRLEDNSELPISRVRVQDRLLAFAAEGQVVTACVQQVITHEVEEYRILKTASVTLHVTAEHPFYVGQGRFKTLESLGVGDVIYAFDGKRLSAQAIESITTVAGPVRVYNLRTDAPNTFFANGVAVHNKGGGGYRGGSRGGSGGKGDGDPRVAMIVFAAFLGLWIFAVASEKNKQRNENLDFVYRPSVVAKKRDKTMKLLEFLARQDPSVSPPVLLSMAEDTFRLLQKCWQARDYGPMKPLMMKDLYVDHYAQLEGMKHHHEINMIEGLKVDRVELVNVRYPFKADQREFTALITATARDYYVDDRTQRKTRGDDSPAQFQEFWTFQYTGTMWRLREIEQSRESSVLKEDNFFEQFTDTGVRQIYGSLAAGQGASGPWLEKEVEIKETRIERMLNFLVQTDPVWDRQEMVETSRRVFLEVITSWESGVLKTGVADDVFPDVWRSLQNQIEGNREKGLSLEFRNLCVRKVELILVRNFADNGKDEFVVRIRAHAQRMMMRAGQVIRQDEDVVPFEQHLTFGRMKEGGVLEKRWRLKEILAEGAGKSLVNRENLDEDSNLQQLQWYYQHTRAV